MATRRLNNAKQQCGYLVLCASVVILSGCGQFGPLYLPESEQESIEADVIEREDSIIDIQDSEALIIEQQELQLEFEEGV